MTSSSKLNEADFNYLLDILNDEEERQYANTSTCCFLWWWVDSNIFCNEEGVTS